jgi:hypothetical protein
MDSISIVLRGTGEFLVSNGSVKEVNGKPFFASCKDGRLDISVDEPYSRNVIVGNSIMSVNGVSVSTSGDDIYISTSKKGKIFVNNVLMIQGDESKTENLEDERVDTYNISSLSIDEIKISGTGSLKIRDSIFNDSLEVKLSGQGSILINGAKLKYLDVKLSGQGNMNLSNCSANRANFKVSGMGSIGGSNNVFNQKSEKVSGMGSINI